MNEATCGFLKHRLVKSYDEPAGGRSFRFVESCSCGRRVQKSIPLHDNDLLANIHLTKTNYWIDKEVSTTV